MINSYKDKKLFIFMHSYKGSLYSSVVVKKRRLIAYNHLPYYVLEPILNKGTIGPGHSPGQYRMVAQILSDKNF